MGGKSSRGSYGSRKHYRKASRLMDDAIHRGDHDGAAKIGIKLAGALLGIDPLISGIEAVAKGYQVGRKHGPREGIKAAAMELGTSIAAGGIAEGFTAGAVSRTSLNEDQKRIVSASVSVALEEALEPVVDKTEGWK
ncbi:MAG: hypothetical protein ACFFER_12350 [Candidatus Thorarchaeota archaeon]